MSTDYSLTFHEASEYTGSVQVHYLGSEGRICSDSWDDADARVACREMNFQDGQAYSHYRTSFSYFNYDGPYWSSEFKCRQDTFYYYYYYHPRSGELWTQKLSPIW